MRISPSLLTGDQLRAWRKRCGWTQEQLAAEFGLSRRTVQYYESGEIPIPLPVARLVSLMAGPSPDFEKW